MFRLLYYYFKNRKKKEKRKQFINGYDYAAGALLRKDNTPEELESYCYSSDLDDFDYGMLAAMRRLDTLGI